MATATCSVAASTANLSVLESDGGNTLTGSSNGALALDSVTLAVGDIVMLKDQTDDTQNGLFTITALGDGSEPFVIQRLDDDEHILNAGLVVFVLNGTANGSKLFVLKLGLVKVGTTSVTFMAVA